MKLTDVLDKPEHWTQDVLARSSEGLGTMPSDPDACAFCLMGAAAQCCETGEHYHEIVTVLTELVRERGYAWPARFNDDPIRTFAEVHAVCVRADEILAEKGE